MRQGGNLEPQADCDPSEQDEGIPPGTRPFAGGGRREFPDRAHSLPADREPEGEAEQGGNGVHLRGARLQRGGVLPQHGGGLHRREGGRGQPGGAGFLGREQKGSAYNLYAEPSSFFI